MKIEILFRGKVFCGKEWVYGCFGYNTEYKPSIIVYVKDNYRCTHIVHEETIGQFTGLTDKNGVKIFENDIINVPYNFIGNKTVEYLNEQCRYNISNYNLSKIYVIGNIHEQMKQGIEFYEMLTDDEQNKFEFNITNYPFEGYCFEDWLIIDHVSFSDFIDNAFYLIDTKEGRDYWIDLIEKHSE